MYLIAHKESAKTKIILCLKPDWICLNHCYFRNCIRLLLLPRFQNDMKNNNTANAVPTGGREVVVVGITGTNSEQLHKELNETTVNSKGSREDDDYIFEEDISLSIPKKH
ncbi:hypothetical protein Glove_29g62 [Diversispora epigaea]|uniref:Uncharacterized protein n=1 Tax=Diversispora epigaea TaxID=1348612 RepID=A0A397JSF1_9GLOM|nr:hypothetical protein Glove_29g62 [Diversispora epigaea]